MTIYVCYVDCGYDGYSHPCGVFSTEELAKKFAADNPTEGDDTWEVEELVVDEPATPI